MRSVEADNDLFLFTRSASNFVVFRFVLFYRLLCFEKWPVLAKLQNCPKSMKLLPQAVETRSGSQTKPRVRPRESCSLWVPVSSLASVIFPLGCRAFWKAAA